MTEPSQYFKGRTVQEQMNEVIGYVDVRSAEVATDAIAADVAQVHSDAADAHADALAAAASAAAAAGTLANAVKKTGEASQSIAGDIDVSGVLSGGSISAGEGGLGVGGHSALQDVTVSGNITVPTPTANGYAANKKYVDDADALKADKTYVDAQDALKLNITDVNQYALGLTDNQNFTGIKTALNFPVKNQRVTAQNEEGWHLMYSWNAGNTTANQIIIFLVRYKQQTNGFGMLLVDIKSTSTNITWLLKGSGVPDDTVIVARDYATSTTYLYLYGYRLETECWGCSRATSVNPVEVTMSSTSEVAVLEPTTADFDTVVKI